MAPRTSHRVDFIQLMLGNANNSPRVASPIRRLTRSRRRAHEISPLQTGLHAP
jgi:hypothetical protein